MKDSNKIQNYTHINPETKIPLKNPARRTELNKTDNPNLNKTQPNSITNYNLNSLINNIGDNKNVATPKIEINDKIFNNSSPPEIKNENPPIEIITVKDQPKKPFVYQLFDLNPELQSKIPNPIKYETNDSGTN